MDVTQGTPPTQAVEAEQADQVMDLLEEHVPLSLLMDLTPPGGPNSREILNAEGAPEQHWWVQD